MRRHPRQIVRVTIRLLCGDALEQLRLLAEDSVDAVVADPPYGLSFMGKDWDHGIPGEAFWREALRVAKPGAHLLAFGGTRTFHRLACAIEDAGWEMRDCLGWIYASGFPKSKDAGYALHERAEQEAEHDVRFVRAPYLSQTIYACSQCGQVLLACLSEPGASARWRTWSESKVAGSEQPCLEGWSHTETSEGELRRCPICSMSHGILADGAQGWLRDGTPSGDGSGPRALSESNGGRTPSGPRSIEQQSEKPRAVLLERSAQAFRGWGTGLKPAWEPIILARKPLEGTVAENMQKWGTGALNIDGCRVGYEDTPNPATNPLYRVQHGYAVKVGSDSGGSSFSVKPDGGEVTAHSSGRWPANLIHDGSEEVVGMFPQSNGQQGETKGTEPSQTGVNCYGKYARGGSAAKPRSDSGSAARFFYCAKASKEDRGEGNKHPTVKPTDLMRYLCRLVTPLGGTVLDPVMGSGSTGKAAVLEGFSFIGIDNVPEYVEMARRRIEGTVPLFVEVKT